MTTSGTTDFQRARTPEQQAERRRVILDAARAMLAEQAPEEVSLRDLSARVGLAKSNVVRYFPTREAVFLEVLVEDWASWLDEVTADLARRSSPTPGAAPSDSAARDVASALATTLAAHPRFGALLAATPGVLERNIPVETARVFKRAALDRVRRLAGLVSGATGLHDAAAFRFAGAAWALTAGAWPMAHPSAAVAQALEDPELNLMCVDLVPDLTDAFTALLVGLGAGTEDLDT